MRNMSFALTTAQILDGSKDVTRRMGWRSLKPGDLFQPVEKCMGLKKGEKLRKLGSPMVVVSIRREMLQWMTDDETRREGFPEMTPNDFVEMFCMTHKGCKPTSEVTRIEFRRAA